MCADLVLERAEETCATIRGEGGEASAIGADVTSKEDCERMVAAAVERFGKLDVLHNNVGIDSGATIRDLTEDEWDRVLNVNLKSMVLATQAAVPHLEASDGGSIINISSIASMRLAGLGGTSYMASKAGVNGLTMSLAGQLAESRIRVNAIAPGLVYGPIVVDRLTPEVRERRRLAGLIKDEGTPWDVAWAAVYLASDESRWVTGQVIVVDGGTIIRTLDTPRE